MKIDILTLFPSMFEGPFDTSMLKKAKDGGLVEINIHNLRDWATDKHKTVDDRPCGGGKGMVIRVDVVDRALQELKTPSFLKASAGKAKLPIRKSSTSNGASKIKSTTHNLKPITVLLSPQGKVFNQAKARELVKLDRIILIAGHYEGFDERIAENLVDEEISIGDYVLTGGEIPAMVVTDTIVRLIPGVLEKPEATSVESFSEEGVIEYPQYTRPEEYKGWKVPDILLSGNHKEIEAWRKKNSPISPAPEK